jgi:hypothetical protein
MFDGRWMGQEKELQTLGILACCGMYVCTCSLCMQCSFKIQAFRAKNVLLELTNERREADE